MMINNYGELLVTSWNSAILPKESTESHNECPIVCDPQCKSKKFTYIFSQQNPVQLLQQTENTPASFPSGIAHRLKMLQDKWTCHQI